MKTQDQIIEPGALRRTEKEDDLLRSMAISLRRIADSLEDNKVQDNVKELRSDPEKIRMYCPACDCLVKSSDPRISLDTAWKSHLNTPEHYNNLKIFKEHPPKA